MPTLFLIKFKTLCKHSPDCKIISIDYKDKKGKNLLLKSRHDISYVLWCFAHNIVVLLSDNIIYYNHLMLYSSCGLQLIYETLYNKFNWNFYFTCANLLAPILKVKGF